MPAMCIQLLNIEWYAIVHTIPLNMCGWVSECDIFMWFSYKDATMKDFSGYIFHCVVYPNWTLIGRDGPVDLEKFFFKFKFLDLTNKSGKIKNICTGSIIQSLQTSPPKAGPCIF